MKTIIQNTAKVITGLTMLFIYLSVARIMIQIAQEVDSVASAVLFTLLTSFIVFLCYIATALYIGTIKDKY